MFRQDLDRAVPGEAEITAANRPIGTHLDVRIGGEDDVRESVIRADADFAGTDDDGVVESAPRVNVDVPDNDIGDSLPPQGVPYPSSALLGRLYELLLI